MARKRSELEEELMTEANIVRVIKLLEPTEGKAITKKDACQILGMAYNTTRLSSIIEEYKQKQVRIAQRKAELRGKPATQEEIVYIISEYLNSETIDSISKSTFRSPGFVKQILENNDVPIPAENKQMRLDGETGKEYLCLIYSKKAIDFDLLKKQLESQSNAVPIYNRLILPSNIKFSNNKSI